MFTTFVLTPAPIFTTIPVKINIRLSSIFGSIKLKGENCRKKKPGKKRKDEKRNEV